MRRDLRKSLLSVGLALGFAALAAIPPSYAEDPTDPIAQFRVGYLYERGDGVAQDYKEAMRLYLLSAAQGNAVAQFRIGYLYEKDWGVPQDDAQAMRWYKKAAAQGNQPANSRLTVLKVKHPEL
jgi:TPR repeat protein